MVSGRCGDEIQSARSAHPLPQSQKGRLGLFETCPCHNAIKTAPANPNMPRVAARSAAARGARVRGTEQVEPRALTRAGAGGGRRGRRGAPAKGAGGGGAGAGGGGGRHAGCAVGPRPRAGAIGGAVGGRCPSTARSRPGWKTVHGGGLAASPIQTASRPPPSAPSLPLSLPPLSLSLSLSPSPAWCI